MSNNISNNPRHFYEFDSFRLDTVERQLRRDGKNVPLTPKAFETLLLLVENSGRVLEKEQLMQTLWPDTFVEEGNLSDNISKIRQALGDSRKEPKYIETVSRRGYRFVASVREEQEDELDLAIVERTKSQIVIEEDETDGERDHVEVQREQEEKALPASPGLSARWRLSSISPAAVCAIAAVGLLVVLSYTWITSTRRKAAARAPVKSIAVLPFKPLVAGSRDESLELGMTDTLITTLGNTRQIIVRPVSAVRRYTDLEQDAVTAGREMKVESALEGTIQRAGERIRVTARLVRIEDGETLWAETFDEKFTDIFAVQDLISQRIIASLKLQLSGEEQSQIAKHYTENTEAYQLYLKGRYFWNKITPEGFQKSLEYYQQAIERDPNYALAYVGIADSYNLLGSYGVLPLRESHPKARAAALKALEIDDNLAEAHNSLAAIIADYYWDWAAAEKHFKRAIELNPNYPVARYWYSQYLERMGRLDEAITEAKRAQTLDPVSHNANAHVGIALYRARRYGEAIAHLHKALEMDANALDAHIFLGFAYVKHRRHEEAIAEFQRVVTLSERNPSLLGLLGYGYAVAGKRDEAQAILKELDELQTRQYVSSLEIALIYIGLEEREQAFAWLEKAYHERAWMLGFLKVEPVFDSLRSDPRFTELMRRVGLTV